MKNDEQESKLERFQKEIKKTAEIYYTNSNFLRTIPAQIKAKDVISFRLMRSGEFRVSFRLNNKLTHAEVNGGVGQRFVAKIKADAMRDNTKYDWMFLDSAGTYSHEIESKIKKQLALNKFKLLSDETKKTVRDTLLFLKSNSEGLSKYKIFMEALEKEGVDLSEMPDLDSI